MTKPADALRVQAEQDVAAAARMGAWIASILRDSDSMGKLLSEGRVLRATATLEAIEAWVVNRSEPSRALAAAKVADQAWFLPEERTHAHRVANRLAAELRREWELR